MSTSAANGPYSTDPNPDIAGVAADDATTDAVYTPSIDGLLHDPPDEIWCAMGDIADTTTDRCTTLPSKPGCGRGALILSRASLVGQVTVTDGGDQTRALPCLLAGGSKVSQGPPQIHGGWETVTTMVGLE